jgi:hypothetical protein
MIHSVSLFSTGSPIDEVLIYGESSDFQGNLAGAYRIFPNL